MNLRTLSITVAVLVALSAVAWYARRPAAPSAADPRVGQPVLAPDLASRAAQVRVTDGGKAVTVTRPADGGWTVPDYHGFTADFGKLSRLIGDLTEARLQRLVTARADRLARLEFKDSTVTLLDAEGKELWRLTLGKSADGGGRFVRFGDEEKGYLANLTLWLDAEPKNWADATLLDLKADDLARVEVGWADAAQPPVVATREKKDDPWTAAGAPEGKRLRADRITSLISSLGSLRFSDTTAPDDANAVAARAHSRTVKFSTFDGKSYTVALGRKPEVKVPKPPATPAPAAGTSAPDRPDSPDPSAPAPVTPDAPAASPEPEFETIPAGPVFAFVSDSDESARVNALMQQRAFQVGDWVFTGLPAAPADLWEDVPAAPPAAP